MGLQGEDVYVQINTRRDHAATRPARTASRHLQTNADPNLIKAERGGADFMIDRSGSRCAGVRPARFDVINADVTDSAERRDMRRRITGNHTSHSAAADRFLTPRVRVQRHSHRRQKAIALACPVMFYGLCGAYSLRRIARYVVRY